MRTNLLIKLLLMGATMTTPLAAQVVPAAESGVLHLNVAATYSPARYIELKGNSFWVQGGNIQVQARWGDHIGLVADARGLHTSNINSSGVGLDIITATAGPRYTFKQGKVSLFGQVLGGRAMAFNGLFPHQSAMVTSTSSFALLGGGGAEMMLSRRVALRAIEANWMYTHLPNGAGNTQGALVLGAGIAYWFK
jgi:peptidoglycan-associated lipoprotein